MERRLKIFLKRYWTILWLIIASVTLVTIYAFAAYTKTNRAKSVVARYGTVNSRFSSNYLEAVSREKPIFVTGTDGKYGDTITIGNYSQTNPTFHFDTVINYAISMKLGYMNGTQFTYLDSTTSSDDFDIGERYITATIVNQKEQSKTVRLGYVAESTYKYEDEILLGDDDKYWLALPGTASVTDTISLEFSHDQKDSLFAETPVYDKKLYVEITAAPYPLGSYTELSTITAQICLSKSTKVESITWTGNFNEAGSDTSVGEAPHTLSASLDGFNYVIQGMGSGWTELKWKSDYLEANEQFLIDELHIAPENLPTESNGWKSIKFYVDSNDTNRYDIQFYRSGTKAESDYDTWEEINSYIEFIFPSTAP